MERSAVISDCEKYRYLLRREWDTEKPRALFVMLNPSTADAEQDDATIRSCIRLCKSWGYGSFEVVNLFAWRATDPKELMKASDPVGPRNDDIISAALTRCDMPICAWGAFKLARSRGRKVWDAMHARRTAVFCLGTTKAGAPKHPLYIKTGTTPVVFNG